MVFRRRPQQYPIIAALSDCRSDVRRGSVPVIPKIRVRSSDRAAISRAVTEVYCPHTTVFHSTRAARPASLEVVRPGVQPVVELRYGLAVEVDAGKFPRLMLIQSCLEGTGTACQE